VRWFLLRDIRVVNERTVLFLHDIISGLPDYDGYPNNNRPTQPLNGRAVERSWG
jgi:carbonic anhydrase